MSSPLITIGITCYNAKDSIAKAVKSALDQAWDNFEIIIVDDCSTDNSLELIKEYLIHPCVSVIKHTNNMGYPTALNSIIKASRGEYIAFFDDDDESIPERLSLQFNHIKNYMHVFKVEHVVCYSRREVCKNNLQYLSSLPIGWSGRGPYGENIANYILLHQKSAPFSWGEFGSCTMMARKETFELIGEFDASFRRCTEWDFAIRAGLKGVNFSSVPLPLIRQYITVTNDKAGRTSLLYMLKLRQKHKEYLDEKRAYRASNYLAYVRFYWNKNKFLYYWYLLLTILFYPKKDLELFLLPQRK